MKRLEAIEAIFLLISKIIYNSLIQVKYLNTNLLNTRSKTVLPIHLLTNKTDDPYFKDLY